MKRKEITNMTITAIFIALLIVQTFVPNIGYVRILPALPAITTIPLTIAIYGTIMGPKWGSMFGLVWGLTRLIGSPPTHVGNTLNKGRSIAISIIQNL